MKICHGILIVVMIGGSSQLQASRSSKPLTKPSAILELYQLMKDMHELFEAHDIEYWIDWGTLLGAVRHGGIIPWDNDLDVQMNAKYRKQIRALQPLLKKLNYRIKKCYFGYQIFAKKVHFDIFLVSKDGPDYLFHTKKAQKNFPSARKRKLRFRPHDIFPLKRYTLGSLEVWGPHNPVQILNDKFGKSWESIGKALKHSSSSPKTFYGKKKITFKLTDADKLPAEPLGPLKDRVKTVHKSLLKKVL